MAKKKTTKELPKKDYILLVETGDFSIKYCLDTGDLIRMIYSFSSKLKVSGLPGNRSWSSGKKAENKVSYNKMTRGNEGFQKTFLEALRALGSRGGKIKLAKKIPDPFFELARNTLDKYNNENSIGE